MSTISPTYICDSFSEECKKYCPHGASIPHRCTSSPYKYECSQKKKRVCCIIYKEYDLEIDKLFDDLLEGI